MNTNLSYEIVSLLFAVLIYLNHYFSYTDDSKINMIFRHLAGLNILTICCNIVSRFHFLSQNHLPETFLTAGYFALGGWMAFDFSIYIDHLLSGARVRKMYVSFRKIIFGLFLCLLLSNTITGAFYTIGPEGILRTDLFPVILILPFSMVLYTVAVTFSYMGRVHMKQTIPSFAALFVIFTGQVLHAEIFPDIELFGTSTTLCLLIILFTLEAPEREKMLEVLEVYHHDLERNVKEKTAQISIVQNGIINGLADLLSGREPQAGSHARRCTYIVTLITDRMKREDLSPAKQKYYDDIAKAAPLHDIGNNNNDFQAISDTIRKILGNCSDDGFIRVTENMVRYHQIRYDGIGSDENLVGEDIPLEARIMTIAEAFDDFMTRPGENENTVPIAMKRIWDGAGTEFDPSLIKYIFACRDQFAEYYREGFNEI